MGKLAVGVNGFGRIGRAFVRAVLLDPHARQMLDIAVINLGPAVCADPALLFAYDSTLRAYPGRVMVVDNHLVIDDDRIRMIAKADVTDIGWDKLGVAWVLESSGKFTSKALASKHLAAGADAVLITAPSDDADVVIIPGVNDAAFKADTHKVVSLGSCTTNCFAPLIKVLDESFGIQAGTMVTVHAYTSDQMLLDGVHKDPRRARAAAINIVPTKTGAAHMIDQLFPQLAGTLSASSLRVPTADVSLVDFTFFPKKPVSVQQINDVCSQHAQGVLRGVMSYSSLPLVSSDFIGNPHSCIVDGLLTQVAGPLAKVSAWYDNEWGYANRLKDFLCRVAQQS